MNTRSTEPSTTAVPTPPFPALVYDEQFFAKMDAAALRSAEVVVPLVFHLIRPKSVVDFGCGHGAWLKVCQDHGAETVLGLDGDYVDCTKLLISREVFRPVDLNAPPKLDRTYDLAISLEVAEHLSARSARRFIAALVQSAPAVLFSAAAPGQGGTDHKNEQWSLYWERLFDAYGFRRLDALRRHIWLDQSVAWYYRQNIAMYVSDKLIEKSDVLCRERDFTLSCDMEIVSKRLLSRYSSAKLFLAEVPREMCRAWNRWISK